MAISTQDLTKGIDFTGLGGSATAAQHNQLIEQGSPSADDTVDVGRGLSITTNDSAVGVPVVPNASSTTKWQRYIWIRRPHSADTTQVMRQYAWNSNIASVPTYLNWQQISVDLTDLQDEVDTASANAATALAAANTAQSSANDALVAAAAAETAATAANNAATAAQTTANSALSTSTTANANASAALTAANSATTAANANIGAARLVGYSAAFQHLRSNVAGTLAEWYNPRNEWSTITNATSQLVTNAVPQQNLTTVSTTMTIPLVTVDSVGALITVAPVTYIMTFAPGIYKVKFMARLNSSLADSSGAAGAGKSYLYSYYIALQKTSDSSIVLTTQIFLTGNSASSQVPFVTQIMLAGLLTIPVSAASLTYRFILVIVTNGTPTNANTNNLGSASVGNDGTHGGNITLEPLYTEFERFAQTP